MSVGFSYTAAGLAELLKLGFGAAGASPFTKMAVGTGTTTPTGSDTGLEAEVYNAPFVLTRDGAYGTCSLTVPAGTVSSDTSITELIIVNESGIPLCREVRNPVVINSAVGAVFQMKPFLVARQVA